jgi:hypothetical protein
MAESLTTPPLRLSLGFECLLLLTNVLRSEPARFVDSFPQTAPLEGWLIDSGLAGAFISDETLGSLAKRIQTYGELTLLQA